MFKAGTPGPSHTLRSDREHPREGLSPRSEDSGRPGAEKGWGCRAQGRPPGQGPPAPGRGLLSPTPVRSWERTETPALHPDEEWTWPHIQPHGAEVLSACQPPWGRE